MIYRYSPGNSLDCIHDIILWNLQKSTKVMCYICSIRLPTAHEYLAFFLIVVLEIIIVVTIVCIKF